MLKIQNLSVMNFENAVRGARNPMNSWDRMDSYTTHIENPETLNTAPFQFFMGENDLNLTKRLVKAGSDHRKFLRQIFVSVDVTAPLYWWKEYDTYKVGTVANSTSTMHKIHAKEFERSDFSCERLHYRALKTLELTIDELNYWRTIYNEGGQVDNGDWTVTVYQPKNSEIWHNLIQLLPSSYNQLRTCTLNYENLLNIYFARKNHKLPEWHTFREMIEKLPYMNEYIGVFENKESVE